MAYINKNDFSIVGSVMDYKKDDYFECDDLIAPSISLLNRKGYKTTFCCSGHPYNTIDDGLYTVIPSSEDDYEIIRVESSENVKDLYKDDTDIYPYYVVFKNRCGDTFYVAFKEKYEFPNLPGDAYLEDGNIYWRHNMRATDNFDVMTKIYEINKAFYEWVEKLDSLI